MPVNIDEAALATVTRLAGAPGADAMTFGELSEAVRAAHPQVSDPEVRQYFVLAELRSGGIRPALLDPDGLAAALRGGEVRRAALSQVAIAEPQTLALDLGEQQGVLLVIPCAGHGSPSRPPARLAVSIDGRRLDTARAARVLVGAIADALVLAREGAPAQIELALASGARVAIATAGDHTRSHLHAGVLPALAWPASVTAPVYGMRVG